jgi:signal transduction histidine kinase/HAMP domain-containing protein
MASFKNISIRNKLIIIQVVTAFLAVLICSAFFLYNDINMYKAAEARNKNAIAEVISFNLISPLVFNDQDATTKMLITLKGTPSVLNATVFDKTGKKFAVYSKKGEESFLFPTPLKKDQSKVLFYDEKIIVNYPVYNANEFVGTLMLNAQLIDLKLMIATYIKGMLLVVFISVLGSFVVSIILQQTISKRLSLLVNKAKAVSETGNYSIKMSTEETDEIGILSKEFNNMLTKIQQSENELRNTNLELEKRVKERTADVVNVNKNLIIENAERRKAEEQLAEKASLLQATFDSSVGGILAVDNKGKIVTLNKRFQEMWHIPENVLATKDDSQAIKYVLDQLKDPAQFINKVEELYTQPEVESFDVLEFKDQRIFERYSMPEKLKENIVGRVWNFIDVTNQKKAERELKIKSEELARSNKELEQFAYITSHDLQEPLRTISNFVELLEEKYKGKDDEDSDHYIKYIVEATLRMQTMIKDLLDFSRVGRNPVFVKVDCEKVIKEIIADLKISIEESNAKIVFDTLPVLTGIEIELKRLFQNLISNAIKFRRKDIPPEITIKVEEKETEYLFSIHDNGIGIEEQYYNKLFIMFQRLPSAQEYQGTGIGLATCKKIVDLHGGKIWVDSKLNEGSTFYFTIHKHKLL